MRLLRRERHSQTSSSGHPKAVSLALCLLLLSLILSWLPTDTAVFAAEGTVSATVGVNPLVLTVSAPEQASVNQFFWIEARLKNRGETKITNIVATIYVPAGLPLITKAERNIGTLPPQKDKSVRWRVRAEQPGSYIILVSASGEYEGTLIETQKTVIVEVIQGSQWWLSPFLHLKPWN